MDTASRHLCAEARMRAKFIISLSKPNPKCASFEASFDPSISELLTLAQRDILRLKTDGREGRLMDFNPSIIFVVPDERSVTLLERAARTMSHHPFHPYFGECGFLFFDVNWVGRKEDTVRFFNAKAKTILFKAEDDGYCTYSCTYFYYFELQQIYSFIFYLADLLMTPTAIVWLQGPSFAYAFSITTIMWNVFGGIILKSETGP